ncbi:hypothetical protein [Kribbella amoyensis]|uniref:hypothetical protein n=1 Tax=Kribbella amoyensis TaxID=996641 RepID=UPI0011A8A902|nr:hypothetical protein [Kribbella amoyensis]
MGRPPKTFEELLAVQADAAVALSGADHSCWNGEVGKTRKPADDKVVVLGTATWKHKLRYDDKRVLRALEDMYEHSGVRPSDQKLLWYRNALKSVLHENSHLLARHGTTFRDAREAYRNHAVHALEEGVAEAYSVRHLDDYIDELGLEEVAPGLKDLAGRSTYPKYAPAALHLADQLGAATGLDTNEVLRRLTVVNPAEKWPVVADLVLEANQLHEVVPSAELPAAKARIVTAMQSHFAGLTTLKGELAEVRGSSAEAGRQAFAAGQAVAGEIGRRFAPPQTMSKEIAAATTGISPLRTLRPLPPGSTADPDRRPVHESPRIAGPERG